MKPHTFGIAALILGAIGIILPCLFLAGNSSAQIQMGVMISGSVIFGSGTIATTIALKK
jgi:hypothetical protein